MMVSGQSAAMPTDAVSASSAHSRMRWLHLKPLKMEAAKVGIDCAHPPHLVEKREEAPGFIAGVEIRATFIAIGQFALDVTDVVHYQQRLVVFPILVRWLAISMKLVRRWLSGIRRWPYLTACLESFTRTRTVCCLVRKARARTASMNVCSS